jgi:hypothetical protein
MTKKLAMVLPMLLILGFVSASPANAHWWTKAWHSASSGIKHAANTVATGIKHDANTIAKDAKTVAKDVKLAGKILGNAAKEAAKKACTKLLPPVLKMVVGKACKTAAVELAGSCNAALDVETMGMGTVACDASAVVLWSECRRLGKVGVEMIRPITDKACAKI